MPILNFTVDTLSSLPGRPFEARPGTAVLVMPFSQACRLPKSVEQRLRLLRLREYTNGVTCWIEIPVSALPALLSLALAEEESLAR